MIKYATQDISKQDILRVTKTLKSSFITQGPEVEKFEQKISRVCDVKYCVSVNSATSALFLAYKALGVSKGDYVWTSPITFVSTINSALHLQAKVDFVDINASTFNISASILKKKLEKAKSQNRLPKVITTVHLGGSSPNMREIFKLSKIYKFKIIEDASHSLGGNYLNYPIGSCKYSDICVFSFHPVKIITTGEGGMFLTNKFKYFNKAKELRSHGIIRNKKSIFLKNEIWNYQQIELGLNLRMSDIQASLGLSQLSRLKSFIMRRNQIAQIYNKAIKELPLIRQEILDFSKSSYHLYIVKINELKTTKTRNEFYQFLKKKKIEANFHYIPVYRHPYYKKNKIFNSSLPNAEEYFNNAISLPIHTKLSQKEINYIINCMRSFFN